MSALSFALLALSQPAGVAAEPEFTMEMAVSPATPEGQGLIASKAAELCGGRHPRLGRYSFKGRETLPGANASPPRFEVRQSYSCTDAPPEAPAGEAVADDWQPSAADEAEVRTLTRRLFDLTDVGRADALHALWSPANREMEPLAERSAALARFREEAGKPQAHRIVKITWYTNPQGGLPPGAYAAVDYERSYSLLVLNCGYLIWYRKADGQYELVRQENNIVPRAAGLSAADVDGLRTAWRCPAP